MMNPDERPLLNEARGRLAELLPEYIELVVRTQAGVPHADSGRDEIWELSAQSGSSEVHVEARTRFMPKDVGRVHGGLPASARQARDRGATFLVVAPWLSARSRELLAERGFSYLDLTGNVLVKAARPAVFVRLQGADRDPHPRVSLVRGPASLQGPKVRRLVRLLVDFLPPFHTVRLAEAGGLSRGYVSRLLDSLDGQALLDRAPRGAVERVDWPALLQEAAKEYSLTRTNAFGAFISMAGAQDLYRKLAGRQSPAVVVTGSFAANAVSPTTAPTQLALYAQDWDAVQELGRLLPTESGADVLLLRPEDPGQLERPRVVDGLHHVGLSQLVLDTMHGPGRLPEEGAAVLQWMRTNEPAWRHSEFDTEWAERIEAHG
jgi:hypothetical protein